ncbi:hypothetical protein niasHT_039009 [Heterodera trifolii]|uniref:Uncharacterized protein n=1 Tax=Heterodera trifolii TaxID=157864 RepID=A0ABD2J5W3_9BILA
MRLNVLLALLAPLLLLIATATLCVAADKEAASNKIGAVAVALSEAEPAPPPPPSPGGGDDKKKDDDDKKKPDEDPAKKGNGTDTGDAGKKTDETGGAFGAGSIFVAILFGMALMFGLIKMYVYWEKRRESDPPNYRMY